MVNITDHQFAGDARAPFAFGGSGEGRINIHTIWGITNLTIDSEQRVYKAAKACYVSNFALQASDMDSHATPLLTIDVGTDGNDDAFIDASTIGRTGDITLTNVVDESTVAGLELAADDYIVISIEAAAATAVAGTMDLSFDVAVIA